jgi:hemerythrin-like domain-containing protein
LAALHAELGELFLQHQEALLSLDLATATELLARYESSLRRHLEAEEALLLPELPRAGPIRGAAPELFTGEHERLMEFLARFRAILAALSPETPALRRRVLELLDAESGFKRLQHHHELREETHLFPALDRVMEDEERRGLLSEFMGRALK